MDPLHLWTYGMPLVMFTLIFCFAWIACTSYKLSDKIATDTINQQSAGLLQQQQTIAQMKQEIEQERQARHTYPQAAGPMYPRDAPLGGVEKQSVIRGKTWFEVWVIKELRDIREEARQRLDALYNNLEHIMTMNTKALMDSVKAADTKLEGYVTIITASATAVIAAKAALDAMKDEPTPDDIQSVIDGLNQHLTDMGSAVDHLNASPMPVAPPPGEPAPAPNPILAATPDPTGA